MGLDSKVWLPHFQFVMQTIAISYPKNPIGLEDLMNCLQDN